MPISSRLSRNSERMALSFCTMLGTILCAVPVARAAKVRLYDYHFSFGSGTHNQAQGNAELPESLIWLWRDYDFAKTSQDFVQSQDEKDKPLWRVAAMNRN